MNGSGRFLTGLCFIVVFLFSESLIPARPDHDCPGEGCPVCLITQTAEIFFRQLKVPVSHSGFQAGFFLVIAFCLKIPLFRFVPPSAVRLKVKINR
jgi:hypothetical protein